MMMHNWGGGGWNWGAWIAMIMMMLVFWGAVAAVVIVAIRSWRHHPEGFSAGDSNPENDALRILDTRFARGEIEPEEYTKRRDLLCKR